MKERPILFSAPMVRALLAGTKTQTRRVCKPAQFYSLSHVVEVPDPQERGQVYNGSQFGDEEGDVQFASPYGGRGDRLWVRETWAKPDMRSAGFPPYVYSAEWTDADRPKHRWRPSIHMPRSASRITLEVTGVRVERLQDISEKDAIAEGLIFDDKLPEWGCWYVDESAKRGTDYPVDAYRDLWESINGPGSWEANPWVWVVEFKRLEDAA